MGQGKRSSLAGFVADRHDILHHVSESGSTGTVGAARGGGQVKYVCGRKTSDGYDADV